tara:strand:- start:4963 stop:5925 length:963 start_codon:yes stop_codon:yes gene_type:complete
LSLKYYQGVKIKENLLQSDHLKILDNYSPQDWIGADIFNSSFITAVKGSRGQGKTLWCAINLYYKWLKGYKIFHNGCLKFGEALDMEAMFNYATETDLENCYIFLDEAHTIFDSWNSGSYFLKKLIHYITQIRHKNVNILLTTQYVTSLTSRLNEQIDYVINVKSEFRVFFHGEKKYLVKNHRILSDYATAENLNNEYYLRTPLPIIWNAEEYYGVYDTLHMVNHDELNEYTSDKSRESIEMNREYTVGVWFKENIATKYAGQRLTPQVLANAWNKEWNDNIETKHLTKILKNNYGVAHTRSGGKSMFKIPSADSFILDL